MAVAAAEPCLWQNTKAYPRLYIRLEPNANSESVGSIPYKAEFHATCEPGPGNWIFTDAPYGIGWVNSVYATWVSGPAVSRSAKFHRVVTVPGGSYRGSPSR